MSKGLNVIKAAAARKRADRQLPGVDLTDLVEQVGDWAIDVGEVKARREPVPVPVALQQELSSHVNCKDSVKFSAVSVRRDARKAERMEGPIVREERPKETPLLERVETLTKVIACPLETRDWKPSREEINEILSEMRKRQKDAVPHVSPTGVKIRETLQRKAYELMVHAIVRERFPELGTREVHRRTGVILRADNVFRSHYSRDAVHRTAMAIRSANATRANAEVMQLCKRRGWVRPDGVEEQSEICSVATYDESEADSYGMFPGQDRGFDAEDEEAPEAYKENWRVEKQRAADEAYEEFLDHYGD